VLPTPPLEPATRIVFMHASFSQDCPQRTPPRIARGSRRIDRSCRGHPPALLSCRPRNGTAMSELQDLTALIRANTPLIVIQTQDEARIVELFRQALMHVWRALHRWTITEGLRRIDLDREDDPVGPPDASAVLRMIQQAERSEEHTSELQSRENLV